MLSPAMQSTGVLLGKNEEVVTFTLTLEKAHRKVSREKVIFELDSERSMGAYAVEMAERDLPGIGKNCQWQKVPVEHGVF